MSTRQERFCRIDAAVARVRPVVFETITDAAWARSLRWARGARNDVADQIRAKILDLTLGKPESGGVGKPYSEGK